MKLFFIFSLLALGSCIGPELFTIGGFKITAGTVVTVPAKIEAYDKYKKEKENDKND